MNNFLYESKVFIFFFLSIFGFFRFFLTSNFFVKESKVLLPQRLTDINNKRFYGTARNRNKARRGRSDKRFDARRNMHFKDLDAFGPKRPKMSILSQFFFIIGQCFMNIIWLSSDLVRCFFRLLIGFPLFIGYYAFSFFIYKPFKFLVIGLFNVVIRFFTWKLALVVFIFLYLNSKFKSLRNNNLNSIAQHLEFKEKNFPF